MQWRAIPGFPAYEINKRGRIRKADTHYNIQASGRCARLSVGGAVVRLPVVDLIAKAFALNPRPSVPPRTSRRPEPKAKVKKIQTRRKAAAKVAPKKMPEVSTKAPAKRDRPKVWLPVAYMPGYELNRKGVLRDSKSKKEFQATEHSTKKGVPFFNQVPTTQGRRAAFVNVLLEETFGPGAASAAGYKTPDLTKVRQTRARAAHSRDTPAGRRCHDCGRPTTNYRCDKCWAKIRGGGEATNSPLDPDFV